ncbi:MAG: hypothetical protein LYZ66_06040 [Nitrososphaerales archaeon]|nr:hypothetical protein [Nitrososphaerales archaeon]
MTSQYWDKHPWRTLLYMTTMGAGFFIGLFLALHLVLIYSRIAPDPSAFDFYPIMAGLGVIFGFERWWGYESGGINPFHESSAQ